MIHDFYGNVELSYSQHWWLLTIALGYFPRQRHRGDSFFLGDGTMTRVFAFRARCQQIEGAGQNGIGCWMEYLGMQLQLRTRSCNDLKVYLDICISHQPGCKWPSCSRSAAASSSRVRTSPSLHLAVSDHFTTALRPSHTRIFNDVHSIYTHSSFNTLP